MLMLKWIVATLLLFILSGCWDNKDINHRSLPIAMGVSYSQGKYTVFLDIPKVSVKDAIEVVSESGDTINEIIDHISMNMESEIDLLHLKIIVVDKEFAKHGLNDGVASLIRSRHVSPKTLFVICDESPERFFRKMDQTSTDGTMIYDFFQRNCGLSPEIAYTQTWKIFRSIHSFTNDVVIPIIKSGNTTVLESTGSAIIKNGKMVGRLTNEETLLINVFNGKQTQGKIEVTGKATVQIVSNKLSHRSSFLHNEPLLTSKLKLKVIILDTRGGITQVMIKDELSKLVVERFEKLFEKIRLGGADVLGVGQYFRHELTRQQLEDWRSQYFANLKIDLEVSTSIRNTGNLKGT
ncbi:Ger(x)C family spore germination protein [Paenibacillus qinlingensis]|uniref:Ger(x)C family spore germination protein n=2 Tax=Paenibacillus qinlingensis TaxID=1837343 RepID=UPI001564C003|nr:Ger(x)C family spore germination protein [Paenibacillus qinlingensis]NQX59149.1 Ger(x)C family spore germination protein [Paenibacillus qinlingensis]